MRNDKDSAVFEPLADSFLDQIVYLKVGILLSLFDHKHFHLANDGTGEAQKLLLTTSEQIVVLRDARVDVLLERVDLLVHVDLA